MRSHWFLSPAAAILGLLVGAQVATAGSNSWTSSGPTTSPIQSLIADPTGQSSAYAGAMGPVLFNLKDGRWQKVAEGTGTFPNVMAVVVDPQDPRTIYVGVATSLFTPTSAGGIYRSIDAGRTWVFLDVYQGNPVVSIVVDPLIEGTVYAVASICICAPPYYCYRLGPSCSARLYKSTDSGLTWTRQGGLEGVKAVAINPRVSSTLYAIAQGGIFKSLNEGNTWAPITSGFSFQCPQDLAISPTDPNVLFVTTRRSFCPAAVYRSTNGGATWKPTNLTFEQAGGVSSIAIDPTNEDIVYVAAVDSVTELKGAGFFRSVDGGETWNHFDAGLPDLNVDLVAVERDGLTLHVAIYQKGIFDYTYALPLRPRARALPRTPTTIPPR